ncbi:hypothetical protein (DUF674) [Arabidopsis thaliana]|uniref:Uncharacterized protein n=1 Tax=Arabidopsis thaliana TaxID=3702 RepID=F4I7E0_ARATH|nr:hypothetical protein (DUF674) [Arabidopsis thaliana]AEE28691.1 hypothetical protein (DUF674) [Arabidopsis thaliana]|eukprot:NP_683298.1 hypothetical protein (DUF674) [Arabidopsis thaliana]
MEVKQGLTLFARKQDMKSVWEITGSNIDLVCIGNFCRSLKDLSSRGGTDASTNTCMLPWQYSLQKPLLGVSYLNSDGSSQSTPHGSNGLVKRGATYIVSDDLTICVKKKFDVNLDDIFEHEINIGKTHSLIRDIHCLDYGFRELSFRETTLKHQSHALCGAD